METIVTLVDLTTEAWTGSDVVWPASSHPSAVVSGDPEQSLRELFNAAVGQMSRSLKYDPRSSGHYYFSPATPERLANARLAWPQDWDSIYGVLRDGRLVRDDARLNRLTVSDYARAVTSYYYEGDVNYLILVPPQAVGGNGHVLVDWVTWLEANAPEVVVGIVADRAVSAVTSLRDRRIRSVAEDWIDRRIDSPMLLKAWIEKKASWSSEEVSTRLSFPLESAEALLTSLGYELGDRGVWELSGSASAKGYRTCWDEAWMREVQRQLDGSQRLPVRVRRWLARRRPPLR